MKTIEITGFESQQQDVANNSLAEQLLFSSEDGRNLGANSEISDLAWRQTILLHE
jgi:hypothetical protein